ncbi:MAG: FtsX-like permease family protein, partial [Spirochaetota bacterium]
IEGETIPEGEKGIIISKVFIDNLSNRREKYKDLFKVGNTIKLSSFSKTGTVSIIKLKIYGILDMAGSDFAILSNIVDFNTFQKLLGYDAESKVLSLEQIKKLEENKEYFEEDADIESLISGDIMSQEKTESLEESEKETETEKETDKDYIEEKLQQEEGTGATQYIVIRLKDPSKMKQVVNDLNNKLKNNKDLPYKAVNYIQASGSLGDFISFFTILVTVIILIIQVISIIIITNSVLMGILERVNEIGTMRAIGAQRTYIFGLIYSESIILSIAASIIGVGLSLLGLWIVGAIKIPAENIITAILFGGEWLSPTTNILNILIAVAVITITTIIATSYPVRIATKISPLEAINKT